ncbi:MAG: CoA-acylating methylmalonate-semialdehyde dehydrogenase [Gemmataceae bacterium]|nr:CoA-acylating methylmalonate-semialdehyde dehydrogenase [Gemmataceae bacterium]MDW8266560.1 CoA-acylating methylmalonate-semialdehyde dehydrogenase [Gemmataceae bacterium]
MTATTATPDPVPILSGGRWENVATPRFGRVYNPSTGEIIARVPMCTAAEVDAVVRTAAAAWPAWAATPVVGRARIFFRFRELLVRHADALARSVTREHGKTLAEARASVQRGIEMVEFACGIPSLIMGQSLPDIAAGVDCETVRHPLGVCVGITPFNFPVMVPLWMFPVALVCGNAFVLKPSEKVPLSAVRLGELLLEAGLPPGVFGIVHGDKECVDALLTHPEVAAVSFVGSTNVARHVYEVGSRHGKRVQAAGGAKNHLIIMPDADLEQAARAVQAAAFGCAGERCMAGSVAVPVGAAADPLVELLCGQARSMRVGPTDDGGDVDMGPVISREHLERVVGYLDIGRGEGAVVALDGRTLAPPGPGFFLGPCVLDRVEPGMRVAREEIFGPVLSVIRARSLEDALTLGATCPYGNGASIFTRSGHAAREFKRRFPAGMIGINVGVPAPMAWFPFTGWNQSFFGDLHLQGIEGMHFYTRQKMIMTRWFATAQESHQDPVWKSKSE